MTVFTFPCPVFSPHDEGIPRPRAGVLDISPYVPGKSGADHGDYPLYKLSSNESPLGASALALKAYRDGLDNLAAYPDPSAAALRGAIGDAYGLEADQIVCGTGSDEILSMLANAYLSEGDEAIHTAHGFIVYPIVIHAAGATPISVAEVDYTANVDGILAALSPRTKMVFLANPNNPTGTYLPKGEVQRLIDGLPPHVLLVLDCAYEEYVFADDYAGGAAFVKAHHNVVMVRTFSKIHGLAALRLGWCYGSCDVVDVLNRVRGPFNVNGAAQAAGIAAMGDQAHVKAAAAFNAAWLPRMVTALEALGLGVTQGVGNFLLVHFENAEAAAAADAYLAARGCLLRPVGNYDLPKSLRLSLGSEEANKAVITYLAGFLGVDEVSL